MSLSPPDTGFRIHGWHVLAACLVFFGVVIAADTAFVVLSVKTFPGEVSVTPYEDGLVYDKALAQQTAQARLGWRAVASAAPDGVLVEMRDRQGAPLAGLKLSGRLERPATESGRHELVFRETAPGRYAASAPRLSGAWDLTATVGSTAGETFIAERRLTWP